MYQIVLCARGRNLVDTRGLDFRGRNVVRVRISPGAPNLVVKVLRLSGEVGESHGIVIPTPRAE